MEVFTVDRRRARAKVLDEHVRAENRHDLEGILRTFGGRARYHDEAWSQHHVTPVQHPITTTRALFRALLRRARRELRLEDGHGSPAFENPHAGAG